MAIFRMFSASTPVSFAIGMTSLSLGVVAIATMPLVHPRVEKGEEDFTVVAAMFDDAWRNFVFCRHFS